MFQTRLKELREMSGYRSQQAFADAFGVAQSTVGGWEAGKREPNYETTIRLADFFSVSIDSLLGYKGHSAMSDQFKRSLSKYLEWIDLCGDLTEPEAKADYDTLTEYAESPFVLTIDEIFRASDLAGESINDMLCEDYEPGMSGETKKSPDEENPTSEDVMNEQIMSLVGKMPEAQKILLLSLLQTTVERNQGTLLSAQASEHEGAAVFGSQFRA